jgi:hypothetical protein
MGSEMLKISIFVTATVSTGSIWMADINDEFSVPLRSGEGRTLVPDKAYGTDRQTNDIEYLKKRAIAEAKSHCQKKGWGHDFPELWGDGIEWNIRNHPLSESRKASGLFDSEG